MPIQAERIKFLRIERKLSITELSNASGVSRGLISDIESGQRKNTTVDTLCKLAKALGVEVSELYSCD